MKITVLGAGLVGGAIVKDLAKETGFEITAVDASSQALRRLEGHAKVKAVQADLQKDDIHALLRGCDLVVCAVPGFMGFATLKRVVDAGKDVVDISFFPEDAFLLDELAQKKGVRAVVDCGVAPGLCNVLAGRVDSLLDQLDSYVCYVGGLPRVRRWPYEYGAVFSPSDVLEEYTRLAYQVEDGREVVRPALSEVELLDFPEVGTLEAFNTDGLRSLRKTLKAPFMKEKTMRYPGHANLMRVFRESGFFSPDPIQLQGQAVSPLALTSKLLAQQWQLKEGEEDLTVMRVALEGLKKGQRYRYSYDLLDRYDAATHTTSMARTTGYTCSIVARQLAKGLWTQKGICPPEFIGRNPACFEHLMAGYAQRHIQVKEMATPL